MTDRTLVPAIVQDHKTGEILMLAYMDDEALKRTKETGYTWFWSRSRQKYWNKGETSGNKQRVLEMRYDCDEDTYVVLVEQIGGAACHTGNRSCFYRRMMPTEADVSNQPPQFEAVNESPGILGELQTLLSDRKEKMPADSYTSELFRDGDQRILDKISEESAEVIRAATEETDRRVVEESADLVFHLMVLLANRGLTFSEVERELKARRK